MAAPSPTYGDQEGTAYNGHFGCTCYHPLFVFNQFGDLERCALRPGNVHSAHEWRDVLDPVVARYRNKTLRRYFRGDAAFASPEVYEFLEAEGFKYAIRLPANKVLHDSIAHLLKRPVGRPPKEVRRIRTSAGTGSWTEPRRVVAKVEWHSGELYPRVGFIVTNLSRPAERVVAFYNQRDHCRAMDQGRQERIKWTRLSCRSLRNNAVRLQLHALAYNLGNEMMRTLATAMVADDAEGEAGQIGAKVVSHGRYVTFQLAEVAVPRSLFQKILSLIDDLRRSRSGVGRGNRRQGIATREVCLDGKETTKWPSTRWPITKIMSWPMGTEFPWDGAVVRFPRIWVIWGMSVDSNQVRMYFYFSMDFEHAKGVITMNVRMKIAGVVAGAVVSLAVLGAAFAQQEPGRVGSGPPEDFTIEVSFAADGTMIVSQTEIHLAWGGYIVSTSSAPRVWRTKPGSPSRRRDSQNMHIRIVSVSDLNPEGAFQDVAEINFHMQGLTLRQIDCEGLGLAARISFHPMRKGDYVFTVIDDTVEPNVEVTGMFIVE